MNKKENANYFIFLLWDTARKCGKDVDRNFVHSHARNFAQCDATFQKKMIDHLESICMPKKKKDTAGEWLAGLYLDPRGLPKWMPDSAAGFLEMLYGAENPKRSFWEDWKDLTNKSPVMFRGAKEAT